MAAKKSTKASCRCDAFRSLMVLVSLTILVAILSGSAWGTEMRLTGVPENDRAILAGLENAQTAIDLLPNDRRLATDIIDDWLGHNHQSTYRAQQLEHDQTIWVGDDGNCDFNSIQDAIDAAPGFPQSSQIMIVNNMDYTEQALRIEDKHITLTGISSGICQVLGIGSERITLDGSGSTSRPVIRVRNNGTDFRMQIRLFNLRIQGGSTSTSSLGCSEARRNGGGLNILGRVQATLNNTVVRDNITQSGGGTCSSTRTAHGGGIYFNSESTEDASLTMEDGSGVINNETRSTSSTNSTTRRGNGGGLALFGSIELVLAHSNVSVSLNRTAGDNPGDGGGIYMTTPFSRVVSHAGGFFNGIILNQTQPGSGRNGGGLWLGANTELVLGPEGSGGISPAISSNTADGDGGGVFSSSGSIDLLNAIISNNLARNNGGGIAAFASALTMRSSVHLCALATEPLPRCSRLSTNHAHQDGGALHISSLESAPKRPLDISRTHINQNSAANRGSVAFVDGPPIELKMEGVFVYGNSGSPFLFYLGDQSLTAFHWSTIAGNPDDRSAVFRLVNSSENSTATRLRLHGSIVWEPGATIASRTGPTFTPSRCTIGHQELADSGLSVGSNFYSHIDPELIDPSVGDLRPGPSSPAIDYCDAGTHPPQFSDIAYNPRGIPYNHPTTEPPNPADGDFDVGGYEVQPVPTVGADLSINAEFLPVQASEGQTVALEITAHNLGPDSTSGVLAEYTLPDGYEFLSVDPFDGISHSFSPAQGLGVWQIGELNTDDTAGLTVNLAVTGNDNHLVTVSIEGDDEDPDMSNNETEAAIDFIESADKLFGDRFE